MERFAWKGTVLPGKIEEYKRRHAQIWPEMTEVLNRAGVHNYTIWLAGNDLFGYYECESVDYAAQVQADSPVVARWNESMQGIMRMDYDGRTGGGGMERVFYHA